MSTPPEEPWIEFLDEVKSGSGAVPAAPVQRRRWSPRLVFGTLALAAVLILAGTHLLREDGTRPQGARAGATRSAVGVAPQPERSPEQLSLITKHPGPAESPGPNPDPDPDPNPDSRWAPGPDAPRSAALTVRQYVASARGTAAVATALEEWLDMSSPNVSSDFGFATSGGELSLSERHVEADDGRGTHLVIEIARFGALGSDLAAVGASPGVVSVHVLVQANGFAVSLTAVGPAGGVPSRATLESLGNDPRLVAA